MRVLVLGATGAIGRHVVPLLLARGHEVTDAERLLLAWTRWIAGSFVETIGRSLRVSNAKLKRASGWAPRDSSARQGLCAALAAEDATAAGAAEAAAATEAHRGVEVAP